MFQRLQHFFNTVKTNWSEDPAARGAAKMAAGVMLVVEGAFGLLRRGRSSGRRGRRNMGGLLGGVIGIVMGIVFINVGSFVTPDPPDDAVETSGTIVDVVTSRNSDNQVMHSPVISFVATDGQTYEFTQGMRSSSRPSEGTEVSVMYSESNPQNAWRTDGIAAYFPWAFTGAGILIILSSVFSLIISIVLIVFGVILFKQGRADRAEAGESQGFFSDLFSLVTQARAGEIDIEETAAGLAGSSQGSGEAVVKRVARAAPTGSGTMTEGAQATPPPPPSGPPVGWYVDPQDDQNMRWWDGAAWTDHRRPRGQE